MTVLINGEGHGSEAENKHSETYPTEPRVAFAQRNRVVQRDGMTQADEEQNRAPQKPTLPIEDSERDQRNEDRLRNAPVILTKQSVCHVSAIKLAYGKQVERCREESKPCRDTDRV